MKIIKKTPLTLAEIKELIENKTESKKVEMMREYINKFLKLNPDEAKKFREELKQLNIPKLDDEYIVKIVDIIPIDAEDIRKIFVGSHISLNQDEIQKILDIAKKYQK